MRAAARQHAVVLGRKLASSTRLQLAERSGVAGGRGLGDVALVDAGGVYSCAVKSDATLWCWGLNGSGQFGNGTTNTTPNATPSQSGTATWKTVSASNTGIVAIGGHTCGIQTNDTLWCWGVNSSGQVGDGTDEQRLSPAQVGTATWRTVSAGTAHTCRDSHRSDAVVLGLERQRTTR